MEITADWNSQEWEKPAAVVETYWAVQHQV
jgi:hypothetical protein